MFARACLVSLFAIGVVAPASAQVTYHHHRGHASPYDSSNTPNADNDMSYASHPSFQIFDTPYGPGVRVIERCAYPNGWNVTDFSRDLNGVPTGIDHTCPDTYGDRGARADY